MNIQWLSQNNYFGYAPIKKPSVDLYQGLFYAFTRDERNASMLGKHIILPSTFTGEARYMLQTI